MLEKWLKVSAGLLAVLVILVGVQMFKGESPVGDATNYDSLDVTDGYKVDGTTVIDGSGNFDGVVTASDVSASDDLVVTDDATIGGDLSVTGHFKETVGNITGTTTLTTSSAGEQMLRASAAQETITLPAAANATGTKFMFRVAGALTGVTVQITSAEKDNISGTLIVAGAVVDCRAEDYINIITDGEVIGDYVEFTSMGYEGWLIGDSGVLTSGKMTCTDPS